MAFIDNLSISDFKGSYLWGSETSESRRFCHKSRCYRS
jgi:hypothetical protein